MVDPYFEILLKHWEDSEDGNINDDEQTSYSLDEWQAYVPDIN